MSVLYMSNDAFAQEPIGKTDFKDLPNDTSSSVFKSEISPLSAPFEMPSFMQEKDFKYLGDDHKSHKNDFPALKKYAKTPAFTTSDVLYNAMPRPYFIPMQGNPTAYDFNKGGVLTSWGSGAVIGASSRVTMPGLLSRQSASLTAVQNIGNLTLEGSVSARNYTLWQGSARQFGVSGAATYHFNENISATVFGSYYTNNSFHSFAAMPYFGTRTYGGYFTFMGETLGADLGVERYYDPYSRRWETSPIITPKIKFSDKFTLALPVGQLVKEILDDKVFKSSRKSGPMIMPETGVNIAPIPFGPPEMPR